MSLNRIFSSYGARKTPASVRAAKVRTAFMAGVAARRTATRAAARARSSPVVVIGARQSRYPRLRRANKSELNYVDLASASYGLNTTGSITLIATIAQGTTVNQRVGKKAQYKSILMRGLVTAGTTGTTADGAALIIYDKRPTGALPVITDVLTAIRSDAFMNDNNTGRFQVIRRFNYTCCGNAATPSTGTEAQNVDEYIKFNGPITFESAGTGAIGDIDMGALYLITVGNQATGTTSPNLSVSFRVRFTE